MDFLFDECCRRMGIHDFDASRVECPTVDASGVETVTVPKEALRLPCECAHPEFAMAADIVANWSDDTAGDGTPSGTSE